MPTATLPRSRQKLERDINVILARLPQLERQVLGLRLGLTDGTVATPAAVGHQLQLSAAEVTELEIRGIRRLRATLDDATLTDLLRRTRSR